MPMAFATVRYNDKEPAGSRNEGLDNFIQYTSEDGKIFATFYIYKPALADAAMNAVLTDSAIKSRFRPSGAHDMRSLVALGGQERSAIIYGYNSTANGMATAAGFAKIGDWILKMRTSGPEKRAEEVMAALQEGMAAVRLSPETTPQALSLDLPQTCQTKLKSKAKRIEMDDDQRMQASIIGMALGLASLEEIVDEARDNPDGKTQAKNTRRLRPTFDQWCVADRYEIEGFGYAVYRMEDRPGATLVAPYSDTGASFVYQTQLLKPEERILMRHDIGVIDNFGTYSGDMTGSQFRDILLGNSSVIGEMISRNVINAEGNTTTELFGL
ncbi:hypothetical protein [Alterisphingorhabdus coralli]|uniref:Uncharacterized protein n=1 Tax=Alterisphingorhabdus coralli TaxID=3071408 RepID=A0AA97F794_9SPHN|nr:hypothetical protein [Parasphingorhabdus sp. SCSIO 66989]WOE73825.1 hypothetical protein RB602_08060 [Parasphingorhabdus sp. SCSIO 66989]